MTPVIFKRQVVCYPRRIGCPRPTGDSRVHLVWKVNVEKEPPSTFEVVLSTEQRVDAWRDVTNSEYR
ncbi:hypothetical protein FS842_009167 [Serendipita sp. 407]|nr:hypothetical protein FS842_009167 [Serendipita sp. 407]